MANKISIVNIDSNVSNVNIDINTHTTHAPNPCHSACDSVFLWRTFRHLLHII